MKQLKCKDPDGCAATWAEKRMFWEQYSEQIITAYDQFLADPNISIITTEHADERREERKIHPREMRDVIECCAPIDFKRYVHHPRYGKPYEVYRFLILGEGNGRPLHVVISFPIDPPEAPDSWVMTIITVYDPSIMSFQWSPDLTERTCWCYYGTNKDDETIDTEIEK